MTVQAKTQQLLDLLSDIQASLLEMDEIPTNDYYKLKAALAETSDILNDGVDQEQLKAEQKEKAANRLKQATANRKALLEKLRPYKNADSSIKLVGTMDELSDLLAQLEADNAPTATEPPKPVRQVELSFRELQAELKAMGYTGPRAGKGITRSVLEKAYLDLKAAPPAEPAPAPKVQVVEVKKAKAAKPAPAPEPATIAVKLSAAREQGLTEQPRRVRRKAARRIK